MISFCFFSSRAQALPNGHSPGVRIRLSVFIYKECIYYSVIYFIRRKYYIRNSFVLYLNPKSDPALGRLYLCRFGLCGFIFYRRLSQNLLQDTLNFCYKFFAFSNKFFYLFRVKFNKILIITIYPQIKCFSPQVPLISEVIKESLHVLYSE